MLTPGSITANERYKSNVFRGFVFNSEKIIFFSTMAYDPLAPSYSQKGKPLFFWKDAFFGIEKKTPDGVYRLKCSLCGKARLTITSKDPNHSNIVFVDKVDTGLDIVESGNHSDEACYKDVVQYTNHRAMTQMKAAFESGNSRAYEIMVTSLRNPMLVGQSYVSMKGHAFLNSKVSLKSSISRWMQSAMPSQPVSLQELNEIPEALQYALPTDTDQQPRLFLQCFKEVNMVQMGVKNVSNDLTGKVLIFCTQQYLQALANCLEIFVDGTFKTTPSIFHAFRKNSAQLFTVHGLKNDNVFPFLYVLMPCRTAKMYCFVLREIQDLVSNIPDFNKGIQWRSVMMDFEDATNAAFHSVFPTVQIRGCYFHFTQSIWHWINGHNVLRYLYKDNERNYEFKFFVRSLMLLAFLRECDVVAAFHNLVGHYKHAHSVLYNRCDEIDQVRNKYFFTS